MKRRTLIPIAMILLLAVFAGCEAAPKSPEARSEKPNQPAVITSTEEAKTPEVQTPEPKKEVPKPETTESAPQIPEEDTPSVEKKAAQPSVENPPRPKAPENPNQTETPKERETEANPISPPQASTNEPVPKPAPVEEHQHSYTETVVAPTCETGGYTKHVCSCGDSYTDNATDPLGHTYEQTGHADASTSAEGWTEYTCSRCGASYRDVIPKIMQTGASAEDAQRVCDEVNCYIRSYYAITQNRGTYMGITWVQSSADVQGAINSTIGTVDLYAQYYGAKSFCCGYLDDGGGSYTIILYWDTI